MTKDQIIAAINQRVNNAKTKDYSIWTIGITSEPETRKKAHLEPKYWIQWTADSLETARAVETYFLNEFPSQEAKRVKGGTGGDMNARRTAYVYIF